ncbi:MAG: ATP-binding protein [Actinobacteria bacterium]|nr:ATP-binding protein [Actinomycetota bacterium]
MTVTAAPTFLRDYRKAGVSLQTLAEGAVHDLLRRAQADAGGWRRHYDRVAGLDGRVLEIDLAGGPRMLAIDNGELILWRMGDHSLVKKVAQDRPPWPEQSQPLPRQFELDTRVSLFPDDDDRGFIDFANENTADWIYWLDDEQSAAAEWLETSILESWDNGVPLHAGLLGGPGTGKTTILVWLLKQLALVEEDGLGMRLKLKAPPSVVNQIENSTGWDLSSYVLVGSSIADGHPRDAPEVILVDDPGSLEDLKLLMTGFPWSSVVFGFDPLQMADSVTDDALDAFEDSCAVETFWFSSCYRQKEAVGEAAMHVAQVVAASSPFLREDKKQRHASDRAILTGKVNNLEFVNPSGAIQTTRDPDWNEWEEYWRYIYRLRRQGRLWNHWPPLLVVQDPLADINPTWLARIDAVSSHRCSTDDLQQVKGLEYQHVLMTLGETLYSNIDSGFEGSGQYSYNRFRLFRIPFSRAKDSLTTFVFPDREPEP